MTLHEDVARRKESLAELADRIWGTPEVALEEHRSSRALAEFLRAEGFRVEMGVADMPTAFVASYGQGSPVIALLGEYDALPGLSQARGVAEPRPLTAGAPGHGCGHNLLGTAAAGAAVAVKDALDRGEVRGTVRFYGCPAEETLVGKVFMVRAGLFADVDAALTWHPGTLNAVWAASSQAMDSLRFRFLGRAAHAASNPEEGRSALDAVELMDVGANFLREHVPSDARIHYVVTEGGDAPNVVPASAEVWYYVRAPRRAEVEEIGARLRDVALGAALMAGVRSEVRLVTGCCETLPNRVLGDLLQEVMAEVAPPRFAPEDEELALALEATVAEEALGRARRDARRRGAELPPDGSALAPGIAPVFGYGETEAGSTDVGDVSQVVPTAQLTAVTAPFGTPGHSWQNVVAAGSGIGKAGMIFAAEVLARATCRLLADGELVARAREEHRQAAEPYCSPVREVASPS